MTGRLFIAFLAASLVACVADPPPDEPTGGGGDTTPGQLTLSGSSKQEGQSGSSALAGVTISVFQIGTDTPVASTTSDAQGKYSLAITTIPFDGYIKASKASYADTYVYPAKPWTSDATVDTSQLSSTTFSLLNTFAGGDSSKGLIIATIVDASGDPVSGAKISSAPAAGSYKYSDGTGSPTGGATTAADGVAFFMSAPLGTVSISAAKSGMSFTPHAVTTHAGALVSTAISE